MRDEKQYRAFAAGFAPLAHRLAYLLTTDPEAATHLARHALRRTRRRWRDVRDGELPEAIAVRELMSAAVHVTPSALDIDRVGPADALARERDLLWARLRGLSPPERTAYVFAYLPEAVALPVGVDGFGLPSRRTDDIPGDLLMETLQERALLLLPINLDVETLTQAERRRTGRMLGVTAVALAVVAASSGLVLSRKTPAREAAAAQPEVASAATARPTLRPPVPWPTRGNLADDGDALAEMRVAFAAENPSIVGGIQVLFASDLPAGRLGLVAGKHATGGELFTWYFARPGAPERATWWPETVPSFDVSKRKLLRFAVGLPTGQMVMVVLGPEKLTTADVSWRASYPPDGSVVRAFEPLPLSDGATVVDLGSRAWFRVRVGASDPLDHFEPQGLQPVGQVRSDWLTWPVDDSRLTAKHGTADRDVVRGALGQIAGLLGITDAGELTPRVIWGGQVRDAPAALVHATLGSGGDFRAMSVGGVTNVWVVPRGTPDFPAAWIAEAGPASSVVGVLTGPDIARVEFWSGETQVLSDVARPMTVQRFDVPMEWIEGELPDTTIVLRDSTGAVRWTRSVVDLPGPSVTD